MLYWISERSGQINSQQLEHVVKRNFGGSPSVDTWKVFQKTLDAIMPSKPKHDDDTLDVSCFLITVQ